MFFLSMSAGRRGAADQADLGRRQPGEVFFTDVRILTASTG
jgi:hypothetical protein